MRICILGGGVTGVTTAYYLAREGHQVTLLERPDHVAQEASFANGAQLSYSYVAPLAVAKHGVELRLGVRLIGLRRMDKRIVAVHTSAGDIAADAFVTCLGVRQRVNAGRSDGRAPARAGRQSI